jgi:hypothetical protein
MLSENDSMFIECSRDFTGILNWRQFSNMLAWENFNRFLGSPYVSKIYDTSV